MNPATCWSFYDAATGLFRPLVLTASLDMVEANTPTGCVALAGRHDSQRVRVDLATGDLVPYQPPPPPADDWCTWTWDESQWAWLARPTDLALASNARAERDRRLAACDWVVSRSIDRQEPVPPAWSAYRQALRDLSQQPGFPQLINWPKEP